LRLLFVADGRSPIALNWIGYFLETGHEVHLVSTFPCLADQHAGFFSHLASFQVVPVAFSAARVGVSANRRTISTSAQAADRQGLWGASAVGLRTVVRQWLGPLTLPRAARRLREIFNCLQPDLVHAMRIPYEGMLAALAEPKAPLLVSVWGNDFTLHAPSTPLMGSYTRLALRRADGLHCDCHRDERLARLWGFREGNPAVVLPGAGGVQEEIFYPAEEPTQEPLVINPRGVRAYVRNDAFFRAIPLVLERLPQARFLCTGMAGEAQAQRWAHELEISERVELLPTQTRPQMADLFRSARVMVSPTKHDGTPNTLLEAMACGCLPVAGDLESLREWITPGLNGLLIDLSNPRYLAEAIEIALQEDGLYLRARQHNLRLVAERAAYRRVMEKASRFYRQLGS
jgi:glycosyltransferase involved in cell wall biosynthesis